MAALTLTSGTAALTTSTLVSNATVTASLLAPSISLPKLTLAATSAVGPTLAAAISLPALAATGATQNIQLPMLAVSGGILRGNVSTSATLELPSLAVAATAAAGCMYAAAISLPAIEVAADTGVSAALALPGLVSAGLVRSGQVLRLAASLPSLEASATLVSDGLATATISLPSLRLETNVLAGGALSATAMLPRLALAISGYSGSVSTARISLPVFAVSGEAFGAYIGQATLELPMLTLVATIADKVTTTATTFAMNAKTAALTQYSNFNFNSATLFNGVDLVASASGIFALGGALDGVALIDAYARMGTTDFGTAAHKRVENAYFGYRSDGTLRLQVTTDEQETYTYTMASNDVNSLHGNRCKLGRGLKGTYWQFEVGNVDGASFEIDWLRLMAQPLSRKVY